MIRKLSMYTRGAFLAAALSTICPAQAPVRYQPTLDSLNRHPLPDWYANAKLGIFVCWGPYSVPGWAPLSHPEHDFDSTSFIVNNPYAEWYYNVMRIDGSPTQAYHREHYGASYDYYNFVPIFDRESARWRPEEWAKLFRASGAKYVVLTSKFHDGFSLWPSEAHNPTVPLDRQHATRDIVGELTKAVTKQGMRMGVYYSGGFDWTFLPGPIRKAADYETVKPQSEAYGNYVMKQAHELIERYHPSLLWNDIDWPKSGKALQVEADYYNAIPSGVVDDRFGIEHSDFTTAEYRQVDKINPKKWEENRGLGRSFGYNRAEGEAETIEPGKLIAMLVDVVSKNGNRHDTTSAVGAPESIGRLASPKRRGHLRYGAVDACSGKKHRGGRLALHTQGPRSLRHDSGGPQGADIDDSRSSKREERTHCTSWQCDCAEPRV